MATVFLSQHSSNPLEVSSSDVRNKTLLRQYMQAQAAARRDDSMFSSDDPLAVQGEVEGYRTEPRQKSLSKGGEARWVDLDDDMESDDELMREDDGDDELRFVQAQNVEENDESDQDHRWDAHDGTDEERSILLKPREERDEIEEEISDLEYAVPQLSTDYRVFDRLGTGTFSSVYKALDVGYNTKWDNTPWHGHHPPTSSAYYQSMRRPAESKVFVAVKRIYVTSNPERIRNEISIMEDCRGCRHISQLITAFRHEDQVVAIMPYHRNDDFRVSNRLLHFCLCDAYDIFY
jgi:cell division control protein 7